MSELHFFTDPPRPGMVKLKIVSDGSLENSRIVAVTATGVEYEVENVQRVTWTLDIDKNHGEPEATVSFIAPEIDALAELPRDKAPTDPAPAILESDR